MTRRFYQRNPDEDKIIEKAKGTKEKLAKTYNVSTSSIVWAGGNIFVIVKDGKNIVVTA